MEDINTGAIEELRSGNMELATKLRVLIHKTIDKASSMVDEVDTPAELNTIMKTAEIAMKSLGLAPTESITNVQINAISGFEFIEIEHDEPTRQISINEVYQDAIIEDE